MILDALVEPLPLLAGAEACGEPLAALPVIYHLLWCGRLSADLTIVLSPHTVVSTESFARR